MVVTMDAVNIMAEPINAFTVDVEDYFQVSAFERHIAKSDWTHQEQRLGGNMDRLLALLDRFGVKATFFCLGWVAEHHPSIIRRIAQQGHEIASHGYWHRRATEQTQDEFYQELLTTRDFLQQLSGQPVIGYRAPSFSFNQTNPWVYEALAKAGYQYSSSVYPVVHDHYGVPGAPRFKYRASADIWELPLSTLRLWGKNWPISGGGYFRLYPYAASAWAIRRALQQDGHPYVFYMHPWEMDPAQPRPQCLPLKTRFRHYINLNKVEDRLVRLLGDFRWGRVSDVLGL